MRCRGHLHLLGDKPDQRDPDRGIGNDGSGRPVQEPGHRPLAPARCHHHLLAFRNHALRCLLRIEPLTERSQPALRVGHSYREGDPFADLFDAIRLRRGNPLLSARHRGLAGETSRQMRYSQSRRAGSCA